MDDDDDNELTNAACFIRPIYPSPPLLHSTSQVRLSEVCESIRNERREREERDGSQLSFLGMGWRVRERTGGNGKRRSRRRRANGYM